RSRHTCLPAAPAIRRSRSPLPPATRVVGSRARVAGRCPAPHDGRVPTRRRATRPVHSRPRRVLDACQLSQLDVARTAGIPSPPVRRMSKPAAGRVALDHALKASVAVGVPLEELFVLLEPTDTLADEIPESSGR